MDVKDTSVEAGDKRRPSYVGAFSNAIIELLKTPWPPALGQAARRRRLAPCSSMSRRTSFAGGGLRSALERPAGATWRARPARAHQSITALGPGFRQLLHVMRSTPMNLTVLLIMPAATALTANVGARPIRMAHDVAMHVEPVPDGCLHAPTSSSAFACGMSAFRRCRAPGTR